MFIKELHIAAFGPLCDADFTFEDGLNIIEGNNESGKSAVAMFIKFIFYGLSSRAADGAISDKLRYISWSRGAASGYAVCEISRVLLLCNGSPLYQNLIIISTQAVDALDHKCITASYFS